MKQIINFILLATCLLTGVVFAQTTTTNINPSQDCSAAYSGTNVTVTNNNDLVTSYTTTSGVFNRIFIQFDLSSFLSTLPSDAIISSATLKLQVANEAFTDLTVQRITSSWSETGGTFAAPTVTTLNQVNASSYSSPYRTFEIKNMINDIRGGAVNNGFVIRRTTESLTAITNTYKSNNSTTKPVLSISWYRPMYVSAASIVHCSATGNADGSISPTINQGSGNFTYDWRDSNNIQVGTSLNLTGRPYGWYGLKITGQAGDIYYMAFIIGVKCQSVNISFNPGPNYIDDAVLSTRSAFTNYGNDVGYCSNKFLFSSTWHSQSSLLRFRLWVDNSLLVNQANLKLYGKDHIYSPNSNASYLKKVTADWKETTVTQSSTPTSTITNQLVLAQSTSATQNYTSNITSFWNDWKASNTTNYGMILDLQSKSDIATKMGFHSSDAVGSNIQPSMSFIFVANTVVAGSATPGASSICSGSTTTITLTGQTSGASLQWEKSTDGSNYSAISGATSSSYTTLSSTTVDTYYRCKVTSGACPVVYCNPIQIIIKPVPTVTVNNATFCSGTNVTLTATPSIGGGTYLWNTGATTQAITVSPSTTTNYGVDYSLNGCAALKANAFVYVCQSTVNYDDATELGSIYVNVNDQANKVGPYHYQISEDPIDELSSVYDILKDSIYDGDLDSVDFFTGNMPTTNYTFEGVEMGSYYLAVFDSRGYRIFDRQVSMIPTITLDNNIGFGISGNNLTSNTTNASVGLDLFMHENMDAGISFVLTDKTKSQFMGLLNSEETSVGSLGSYKYGFSLKTNNLNLIENGVEGTEQLAVNNNSTLKLKVNSSSMEYYLDGTLIKTAELPEEFSYKGGAATASSGLSILIKPGKLTKNPFFIRAKTVQHFDCGSKLGGFNFKTMASKVSPQPFTWTVWKDGVQVGQSSVPSTNIVSDFEPTNFGPGVYEIRTYTTYASVSYVCTTKVYIGYEASWVNLLNYNEVPNSYSLKRNNISSGTSSYARTENILIPSEPNGWIQFKPVYSNLIFSAEQLRLSSLNVSNTSAVPSEIASLIFLKAGTDYKLYVTGPTNFNCVLQPSSIIRLKITSTGIEIFVDDVSAGTINRPSGTIALRAHSLFNLEGFQDVIMSFNCDPRQDNKTFDYSELKRSLDGGNTLAIDGKVKFTFDEEYNIENGKFLPIKIYDDKHHLKVQSDLDGNITDENGTPSTDIIALAYKYDDNRYELDISNIDGIAPNTYYTLEITTSTNDKRYLKILYKY